MVRKWDAFLKPKVKLPLIHLILAVDGIVAFLQPVWDSIYVDKPFGFDPGTPRQQMDGKQLITYKVKSLLLFVYRNGDRVFFNSL